MEEIKTEFNTSSMLSATIEDGDFSLGYTNEEFQDFIYKKIEYANGLVGDFVSSGDYSIKQEYLKELVAVNKVVRETIENRYYAISISPRGAAYSLKFSIVVNPSPTLQTKIAHLNLIEDVVNPYTGEKKVMITLVAKYQDDNDQYFLEKIKKAFNFYFFDESEGKAEMDENLVKLILSLKGLKLKKGKVIDSLGDSIEEAYLKELIKGLKGMGEYGDWVLKCYMKLLEQHKGKMPELGQKGHYIKCAKLMEIAMSRAKGFKLTPEQIKILNDIQSKRINTFGAELDRAINPPVFKQASVKSAGAPSKSSGGSKGGGSRSSNGKGGSADKKGADKKKPSLKNAYEIHEIKFGKPSLESTSIKQRKVVIDSEFDNNTLTELYGNLKSVQNKVSLDNKEDLETVANVLERNLQIFSDTDSVKNNISKIEIDKLRKNAAREKEGFYR